MYICLVNKNKMENDLRKALAEIETLKYEMKLRRSNFENVLNPMTEGRIQQIISEEKVNNFKRYGADLR